MKHSVSAIALILFVCALSFVSAATCNGIDLYVSATGSDTNSGTLGAPLLTITRADQLIEARGANAGGSMIYVLPGVYTEQRAPFNAIHLRADGSNSCPVTIKSYEPQNPAVLHGENAHTVLLLDYANYRVFQNLIIENGTAGITGYYRGSIIENNTIRNIRNTGNNNPVGIGMFTNNANDDNTIRYNHIYNVRTDGTGANMNAMAIGLFQGNRNTVHNNEVHDVNTGIRQKHHQQLPAPFTFTVYNNFVYNTADAAISLGSSGANVTHNLIVNASDGIRVGYGDGYQINNGFRDNGITHNTIYNALTGINMQWGTADQQSSNTTIRDNVIHATSRIYYIQDWQNIGYSNYNCYSQDSFRTPTQNPTTITTLQGQGYDANSIISDSLDANTYRLTAGSSCRNTASDGQHAGAWLSDSDPIVIGIPFSEPETPPPPAPTGICEATGAGRCYYIDPVNGNDANAGTFAAPWRSFRPIAYYYNTNLRPINWVQMVPGDYLYMMDGIYADAFCPGDCSGTQEGGPYVFNAREYYGSPTTWFTLKAYPGHTPIIDRDGADGNGIRIHQASYWNISGITIRNTYRTGMVLSETNRLQVSNMHVYDVDGLDNNNIAGIGVYSVTNGEFWNLDLHDNFDRLAADTGGVATENSANMVIFEDGNITVRDSRFYHTRLGERIGTCLKYKHGVSRNGNWFIAYNNTFENCRIMGLATDSANSYIHHNTFRNGEGLRSADLGSSNTQAVNLLFEYNTLYNTTIGAPGLSPRQNPNAQFPNSPYNVTYRNNIIYHSKNSYGSEDGIMNMGTYISDALYTATLPALTINDNCYYNPLVSTSNLRFNFAAATNFGPLGANYDLTGWQTLGFDTRSVFSDPLFVNAATGDFRLQSGSPCSAMGVYGTGTAMVPTVQPFFQDNFDTGAKTNANGFSWVGGPSVVSGSAYSGNYAIQFRYGPNPLGGDSNSEQRFVLGRDLSSMWIDYMLYIPPNFVHRDEAPATGWDNNKFFTTWRDTYGSGSGTWQAAYEYTTESIYTPYSRLRPMSSLEAGANALYVESSGLNHAQLNAPFIGGAGPIRIGQWNRIRLQFSASSASGVADGIMRMWVNNQLYAEKTDGLFRNYNNNPPDTILRNGYFMGWSNSGFTDQTDFYIDDVKFYDQDPGWSYDMNRTVLQTTMIDDTPASTTHSLPITIGVGRYRKVIACLSLEHASTVFSNVNYNGVAMTLIKNQRAGTAYLACYAQDVADSVVNETYQLTYSTSTSLTTTAVAWQLRNIQPGVPEDIQTSYELATQGASLSTRTTTGAADSWLLSAVMDTGSSASYTVTNPLNMAGGISRAGHVVHYANDLGDANRPVTVIWTPPSTANDRVAITLSIKNAYSTITPIVRRAGDLNGDGVVNVLDVSLIIQNFKRRSNYDEGADINNDATVNILDMVLLGRNWG